MTQFSLCSLRRKLSEAYESGVKMKFRQARGNNELCVCVLVCVIAKLSRDRRRKHESEERTNSVKISHIQMTRHFRACEHCQILRWLRFSISASEQFPSLLFFMIICELYL